MSAERLREAADRLDERITYWQGSIVRRDEDVTTALLLRGIADELDAPPWTVSVNVEARALALADAVLGGTDVE